MLTKLLSSSKENKEEVFILRPHSYWIEIYKHWGTDLKNTLKKILSRDFSLYKEILVAHEYQTDSVSECDYDKVEDSHAVIGYDNGKIIVINNCDAQSILDSWVEFNNLPQKLPDGKLIPKVNTFDQLIAVMTRINPYYILELATYSLSGKDFSSTKPAKEYSFGINRGEYKLIWENLRKLYTELK